MHSRKSTRQDTHITMASRNVAFRLRIGSRSSHVASRVKVTGHPLHSRISAPPVIAALVVDKLPEFFFAIPSKPALLQPTRLRPGISLPAQRWWKRWSLHGRAARAGFLRLHLAPRFRRRWFLRLVAEFEFENLIVVNWNCRTALWTAADSFCWFVPRRLTRRFS